MFRSILDDIKLQVRSGNLLTRLIIIHVAVFIILNLLVRLGLIIAGYDKLGLSLMYYKIESWLSFPYDTSALLYRPWTIVTCMFVHAGFAHLFWNMIMFYWFGKILNEFSKNKLGFLFFAGGIFATLFSMGCYYLFPYFYLEGVSYTLIGASGAVTAVMIAAATLVPEYQMSLLFIGPVRLKYIALVLFILDLISVTYFVNAGGHFAHIGGAIFGFSYILLLKKGNDLSMLFSRKRRSNLKVVGSRKPGDRLSKPEIRKRIDDILDKINKSGYDSLSRDEKEDWVKLHDKV